jgi:hypothetical protein
MSKEEDKIKHSTRLHRAWNSIKRQLTIAKVHGLTKNDPIVAEPHRLAKHHAMDCGNPDCYLCGNPRKTHKDKLTIQEKRNNQKIDDE